LSGPIPLLSALRLRARVRDGANWSPLLEGDYFVTQNLAGLAVSELMYNPPGNGVLDGAEFEFVELQNTGLTDIDLFGLNFSAGITLSFGQHTTLRAGEFALLVRNQTAFAQRYPGVPVVATYSGRLDNGGETLSLSNPAGGVIFSLSYRDSPPWPGLADGLGFSLVNRAPALKPAPDSASSWRPSTAVYGSPGAADPASVIPAVEISEISAAAVAPDQDFIELHNPGSTSADVSHWFLTHDVATPAKHILPAGTIIPSGGWLAISASSLGFTLADGGGRVYLFSANAGGQVTGHESSLAYEAADPGTSHALLLNSAGDVLLVPQAARTPGAANAGPANPQVVVNEIWYHPPSGYSEMVELHNHGLVGVDLSGWTLEGLAYVFPSNTVIAAGGYLVVTPGDPVVFRSTHAVPAEVPVLGPATGLLQDDGERVALRKPAPGSYGPGITIPVDSVRYNDKAPWSETADGSGPSLQRVTPSVFGDDPSSWQGQGLTPGRVNAANTPPTASITYPPHLTVFQPPTNLVLQVTASDPDGILARVEFFDGALKLGEDTSPPYSLSVTNLPAGEHLFTARAFDNAFASATTLPVLATGLGTQTGNLFPFGSVWKFFDGGSLPAANWMSPAYDDSGWSAGAGELGYGDGPGGQTTVVSYGSDADAKHMTTYFRRRFTVSDASSLASITGRLIRDDGAVVYLNGLEWFRTNMPSGVVGFATPAESGISGVDENAILTSTRAPAGLLDGENLLAVEIHQFEPTSTDISFDLELIAERATQPPDPDMDGDGIPDRWELQYGLAYANPADAALDPDGDRMSSGQEYIAGTHPGNAASVLKMIQPIFAGGQVTLRFAGVAGKTYTVEDASHPSGPIWNRLSDHAPDTTGTVQQVAPADASAHYFRVVTPRRP
jgi:hypothetical protein